MNCARVGQLMGAAIDRELDAETRAQIAHHVEECPACGALHHDLAALSARVRRDAPYYDAPPELRSGILKRLEALPRAQEPRSGRPSWAQAAALAACAALFSALMTFALLRPHEAPLREDVIVSHVASLAEPGRLVSVESTDRHTVKPWFQGRVDFSPAVKDLAGSGFALAGGRLDHVGKRPAAVVVYRIRAHVINLFVWRTNGDEAPVEARSRGFSLVTWAEDGLAYAAVSDAGPQDLARFAELVRAR